MNRRLVSGASVVCGGAVLCWGLTVPASGAPTEDLDREFASKIAPLLKKHCADCHGGKSPTANLNLEKPWSAKQVVAEASMWQRVVYNIKSQSMPPGGGPTAEERQTIVDWAERAMASDCELADAGKVTLRRLNRNEYRNSVRDLLGIKHDFTEDFPSDDVGEGFDNIGEVLSLSPLHLERYLSAAEKAAEAAIKVPNEFKQEAVLESLAYSATGANFDGSGRAVMFTNAELVWSVKLPTPGTYYLEVDASGTQAGPDLPQMRVRFGQAVVDTVSVDAGRNTPKRYRFPVTVTRVDQDAVFGFAFINDYYEPQNPDPNRRDRNLLVSRLAIAQFVRPIDLPNGPITAVPTGDKDLETPRAVTAALATRAFRRPVTPAETDRLMAVYSASRSRGAVFEQAMRDVTTAVLCSPHFLFRAELDETKGALSDFEVAARLSYFLWGSLPDESLTKLATVGKLTKPEVLREQVDRMVSDPKSRNLGSDFALQWLQLRKLEAVQPDPALFGDFDDKTRQDMATEARLTFMEVLTTNKSAVELLDTNWVMVNERLAQGYGLAGVSGEQFRKVPVTDKRRGGLTGMAAVLTVTSNPNRTSPVKRGKWVLEQILGTPPPPPPPGAGSLPEDTSINPTLPMKERLAQHRKNPACANCHTAMDAMGFSLENFDPVGKWRTKDGKFAVDATTVMPDKTKISGPEGLKKVLLARKDDFVRCLAEKLLVYAVGRGLRPSDRCHVDTIVKKVKAKGYRLRELVHAVVESDPFLKRGLG